MQFVTTVADLPTNRRNNKTKLFKGVLFKKYPLKTHRPFQNKEVLLTSK